MLSKSGKLQLQQGNCRWSICILAETKDVSLDGWTINKMDLVRNLAEPHQTVKRLNANLGGLREQNFWPRGSSSWDFYAQNRLILLDVELQKVSEHGKYVKIYSIQIAKQISVSLVRVMQEEFWATASKAAFAGITNAAFNQSLLVRSLTFLRKRVWRNSSCRTLSKFGEIFVSLVRRSEHCKLVTIRVRKHPKSSVKVTAESLQSTKSVLEFFHHYRICCSFWSGDGDFNDFSGACGSG